MHLPFLLGTDPANNEAITLDLAELPHLLVSGTTGSGKSVFLNSLLVDLINIRDDTQFMLVDPKRVEFMSYRPFTKNVYVDTEDTIIAVSWLADHMDERFEKLERHNFRDLATYNTARPLDDRMPRIVLVIDELANLMLGAKDRIEQPLTRLAQMSRAVGIHLVLATQRPTVDVVTGLLKANIPGRVSFNVITRTDSLVILDETGAEDLLGKGQMLARIPGQRGLRLLQGRYIDIAAVEATVKNRTEVTHGQA